MIFDQGAIDSNYFNAEIVESAHSKHPRCHEFEVLDGADTCIICGAVLLPEELEKPT